MARQSPGEKTFVPKVLPGFPSKILLAALVAASIQSAEAQQIGECDTPFASARFVDWSDPTRTFANDQVRLVGLDVGEPDGAAFHILVTYPDPEGTSRACRLVSEEDGTGYASISLRRATARYDSLRGLTIGVPGTHPDGDPVLIEFILDRETGTVSVP